MFTRLSATDLASVKNPEPAVYVPQDVGALRPDQLAYLGTVATPPATPTYTPVPYLDFVMMLAQEAVEAGYWTPQGTRLSLVGKEGQRLFGTMALSNPGAGPFDLGLQLGFRTSHNRQLANGITVGATVCVCSNGLFSGEWLFFRRHTLNCWRDMPGRTNSYLEQAPTFLNRVKTFNDALMNTQLSEAGARDMTILLAEREAVPWHLLKNVWGEYRSPSYPEVDSQGLNAYRLYSALTAVLRDEREDVAMTFTPRIEGVMRAEFGIN